jgi:RsmE family RNA methyltransferase
MKHTFAIYYKDVSQHTHNKSIVHITDSFIINRIVSVLRLKISEEIVLFDGIIWNICEITHITKKEVICSIKKQNYIKKEREITFFLPLVERDYRDTMLYACGAQQINIQWVKYDNCHVSYNLTKELDRCYRVIHSACEQAKQYVIPVIKPSVISFDEMLAYITKEKKNLLYFDEQGKNITSTFTTISQSIYLTCGPEAGYSEREKELFLQSNYTIALSAGPFISRSCDIIQFSSLVIRSF